LTSVNVRNKTPFTSTSLTYRQTYTHTQTK